MAVYKHNENPNAFVRTMRKVYKPIGFKKGYNFTLWFIFGGALIGFILARFMYLNDSILKANAAPGEWFWYNQSFYKAAIKLHLATILPAAFLAVLQFTPIIRYKLLTFHRVNGYLVILLLLIGNVGALMGARHAFGGSLATQFLIGLLAVSTTVSAVLSYINIKRLQIEQHRAWMLRCWFYAGSIITLRLIMIITALIISSLPDFYYAESCEVMAFTAGAEKVAALYPACAADPTGYASVQAKLLGADSILNAMAALHASFGMAGLLALLIHALGVELYLTLTPAEAERLRKVSYERQLERGFSRPGSAGITVDRLGDAEEWRPPVDSKAEKATAACIESDTESMSEVSRPKPTMGWR